MSRAIRLSLVVFLTLAILAGSLWFAAARWGTPGMTRQEARKLSMADFCGDWETTLSNGEIWRLELHEDGSFQALPIRSNRVMGKGRWQILDGAFYWEYERGNLNSKISREINPIIHKTTDKFMLSERMGMTSVYSRMDR